MSAIVTDQFRVSNAKNFVDSVLDPQNSHYVFLSLPNPSIVGFGRSTTWDSNTPSPIDNLVPPLRSKVSTPMMQIIM